MGSSLDASVFGVLSIAFLVISMFRLDELIARPSKPTRRDIPSRLDENGEPILIDPDGQIAEVPSRAR